MDIIAKTDEGVLIKATNEEVREILSSVTGSDPSTIEISIGSKIPAIDYAGTIKKLKVLPATYEYRKLMEEARKFLENLSKLGEAVNEATKL